MTDFDLDRLGEMWRAQPDPEEMARLQRTAAEVSRRARWAQIVDVGAAVVVAGVVIVLVLTNPDADTLVIGGGAIAILLLTQLRERKLRQIELASLTGSTEQMLDQSIARIDATLKRTRFSLISLPLTLVVGLVFGAVTDSGLSAKFAPLFDRGHWLRVIWLAGVGVVVVFGALHLWRGLKKGKAERQRIVAMREAYRREGESGASE